MPTRESRDKAKAIIQEIIRQSPADFNGQTRLYKAFYLAHLYYYLENPGILSDWPIVHMPNGPGIDEGPALVHELQRAGLIGIQHRRSGPFREAVFSSKGNTPSGLSVDEIAAVKAALDFIEGQSAVGLSEFLHEHSRTWAMSKPGQPLNIYLDLLSEDEYEAGTEQVKRLSHLVGNAFGE